MHIPDGLLAPPVALSAGVVGAAGLALALRKVERSGREASTLGMVAAFVFAAQMVNFPVGPGVSGHLMGGTLAAAVLGPWGGAVVVAAVLLVQAFLFGDGGLTALGANFCNMGLIGAVGGYAVYAPLSRRIGGRRGVVLGAMAAAWVSTTVAAGAFAVELAASGRWRDFGPILAWMAIVHAAIGVGEAVLTGLILRFTLSARPDLLPLPPTPGPVGRRGQQLAAGLGVALAVAVFLGPLASTRPDGLEFVGAKLGFMPGKRAGPSFAPIADYEFPPLARWAPAATAVAGALGTAAVFAVGLALARAGAIADRRAA